MPIKIIGHRGARNLAPENTLSSIQAAINLSLPWIEFDVTTSQEGVPFCVHQETLQPNFSLSRLELAGRDPASNWANAHTMSELLSLDAGRWHSEEFAGERMPLLEEVLDLDWQQSVPVIELIDASYWDDTSKPETDGGLRIVRAVSDLVQDLIAKERPALLLGFNPYVLKLCCQHFPSLPRVLAIWEDDQGQYKRVTERALSTQASIVTLADFMVLDDPSWVTRLNDNGFKVWVYDLTPDLYEGFDNWGSKERIPVWQKLIELGVDAIECDFPDKLLEMLDSN